MKQTSATLTYSFDSSSSFWIYSSYFPSSLPSLESLSPLGKWIKDSSIYFELLDIFNLESRISKRKHSWISAMCSLNKWRSLKTTFSSDFELHKAQIYTLLGQSKKCILYSDTATSFRHPSHQELILDIILFANMFGTKVYLFLTSSLPSSSS